MNRLPVAERREQLIEAALNVATRDGIDGATVRAVAAEAGVSLGVVHYCFRDKDELLRAMAHTIAERNLGRGVAEMPESAPADVLIFGVLDELWSNIRATRGAQLLTYELTTTSLRHPELKQVGVDQYVVSWAAAEHFAEEVERVAGVVWRVPRHIVARSIIATIDGFSLAWLVDSDDDAAYQGLRLFAQHLANLTVPVDEAAMLGPSGVGATDDDTPEPRAEVHRLATAGLPTGVTALA